MKYINEKDNGFIEHLKRIDNKNSILTEFEQLFTTTLVENLKKQEDDFEKYVEQDKQRIKDEKEAEIRRKEQEAKEAELKRQQELKQKKGDKKGKEQVQEPEIVEEKVEEVVEEEEEEEKV